MPHPTLIVEKNAARVKGGYPWVFASDIRMSSALELAEPGTLVALADARGRGLGVGYYHPRAALACRILAHDPRVSVDAAFFRRRFAEALRKRETAFGVPYYRLVHSEGDFLPGLIVDRYGDVLVCQTTTAGMERLKPLWVPALRETLAPRAVVHRDDAPTRAREGLPLGVVVEGDLPPMPIPVEENGARYFADLLRGQKTGWFYDQRANRRHVAELAAGKTVLDLYAHTGGFGVAAAIFGAAHVTLADASASALALARQAAEKNGVAERCAFVEGDVFRLLPAWIAAGKTGDVVIADPPAFAKDKRNLAAGLRGYEKLARLCAGLVAPGGVLFIASCSHHAAPEAFRKAVEKGLAGRSFRLLRKAGADTDHPAHPQLPENAYLKALTYLL